MISFEIIHNYHYVDTEKPAVILQDSSECVFQFFCSSFLFKTHSEFPDEREYVWNANVSNFYVQNLTLRAVFLHVFFHKFIPKTQNQLRRTWYIMQWIKIL